MSTRARRRGQQWFDGSLRILWAMPGFGLPEDALVPDVVHGVNGDVPLLIWSNVTEPHRFLECVEIAGRNAASVCRTCRELVRKAELPEPPEQLVLFCPKCGGQHVDKDLWVERPHSVHLCEFCGEQWRPEKHNTVGVPLSPGAVTEIHFSGTQRYVVPWRVHSENGQVIPEKPFPPGATELLLRKDEAARLDLDPIEVPESITLSGRPRTAPRLRYTPPVVTSEPELEFGQDECAECSEDCSCAGFIAQLSAVKLNSDGSSICRSCGKQRIPEKP